MARTPEAVFAYVSDPLKFPEWQRDVVNVVWQDSNRGIGSRFVTERKVPGGRQRYTQEIVELDPPRTWRVKGIEGMLRPNASVLVEPVDDPTRARVTFTLDYEADRLGRVLLPLVERVTPRQSARSYALLKEILESG